MMEITITIDEVEWPQCPCSRFCMRCMENEAGEESDGALHGAGAGKASVAAEKGQSGSFRSGKSRTSGASGDPKREYLKRIYQGEEPFGGRFGRNEKDPYDPDEDGDDIAADCFVFEEDDADWGSELCRFFLYNAAGRAAGFAKRG